MFASMVRICLLYGFIYSPNFQFLGFGFTKLFWIPGVLYVASRLREVVLTRNAQMYFTALLFFFSWVAVSSLHNEAFGSIQFYTYFIFLIECHIVALFIFLLLYQSRNDLILDIVRASILAVLISLFLFFFPELNLWVKETLIYDDLVRFQGIELDQYRGFSVAQGSTFEYGIALGLSYGLMCFLSASLSGPLFWLAPFSIAILINARSGIIFLILGLLLFFARRFRVLWAFVVIGLGSFASFLFSSELEIIKSSSFYSTIDWSLKVFDEIGLLFRGEIANSTFGVLSKMAFFPVGETEVLFGSGVDIYSGGTVRSDVGYVVDIFFGGLVILLLKFFVVAIAALCFLQCGGSFRLALFMLVVILVAHLKGPSLLYSLAFSKIIALVIISVSCSRVVHK